MMNAMMQLLAAAAPTSGMTMTSGSARQTLEGMSGNTDFARLLQSLGEGGGSFQGEALLKKLLAHLQQMMSSAEGSLSEMTQELTESLKAMGLSGKEIDSLLQSLTMNEDSQKALDEMLQTFLNQYEKAVSQDPTSGNGESQKQAAFAQLMQAFSQWFEQNQQVSKSNESSGSGQRLFSQENSLSSLFANLNEARPVQTSEGEKTPSKEGTLLAQMLVMLKLSRNAQASTTEGGEQQLQKKMAQVLQILTDDVNRPVLEKLSLGNAAKEESSAKLLSSIMQTASSGGSSDGGQAQQQDSSSSYRGYEWKSEPTRVGNFQMTGMQNVIRSESGSTQGVSSSMTQHAMHTSNLVSDMTDLLASKIRISQFNGSSQARVTLYPESLGQVNVNVTMQDGKVVAQLITDTMMGKDVLESNLQGLRNSLQHQGLQVDRMVVSQQSDTEMNPSTDQENLEEHFQAFDQQSEQESSAETEDENETLTYPEAEALMAEDTEYGYAYGAQPRLSGMTRIDFTA